MIRSIADTLTIVAGAVFLAAAFNPELQWQTKLFLIFAALVLIILAGRSILRGRKAKQERGAVAKTFHKAASRPRLRPPVKLTSHALTRLNVQRRASGRPPLSLAGYSRATETAPNDLRSQNDWLLYYLLWNSSLNSQPGYPSGYTQPHCEIPHSLEIVPGGGEFGGGD
jgi:hypothetical protein